MILAAEEVGLYQPEILHSLHNGNTEWNDFIAKN